MCLLQCKKNKYLEEKTIPPSEWTIMDDPCSSYFARSAWFPSLRGS